MNRSMISKKLIAFDIDGTIISYRDKPHIPESTIRTLRSLSDNGHTIAIATGRSYPFAKHISEKLNISELILSNGAHIISQNIDIHKKTIRNSALREILKSILELDAVIFGYDGIHVFEKNASLESKEYFIKEGKNRNVIKLLTHKTTHLLSINIYNCKSDLISIFKDIKDIEYIDPQKEVKAKNTSKGNALILLAKKLGFLREDIIAVGDGHNDIEMLNVADTGIAVSSAPEELKKAAAIITEDIDNDGIYKAFLKIGLI